MALDPTSSHRSASPESSGRESPLPRQWRNQPDGDDAPINDKSYRKYAAGVDRALSLFETALQEWADYISFLNRLLKALQARPSSVSSIPAKTNVAKRLSQCLNPALPSGVHQKALEVYGYVLATIGREGLSRDLQLYLPGLAPTLSFASLSVRAPFLDLLEKHLVGLDPRALRPAMKALILALLPGLEEETSEDFDRTLKLLQKFKRSVRPPGSENLDQTHATGDDYFWQCFFLAIITGQSRRPGALTYLTRNLPKLARQQVAGQTTDGAKNGAGDQLTDKLAAIVTSPEPGLLLRCFAACLEDDQLLIQRGFLDLLGTHIPLHSQVLQTRVKPRDLELLLRAAVGVVIRRDMSLNRRLWAWLLGPDPSPAEHEAAESPASTPETQHAYFASKTAYFEEYGLQPLTKALLTTIKSSAEATPLERARPYRLCLTLMDRWEIGGLVVPEVFLPLINGVRKYKAEAASKADFNDVLRSASVFFDGVESGLIYGEIVGLLAQAIGPGIIDTEQRLDKLSLVTFILSNFNVREEEMVTVHAPLVALSGLCMLEDTKERKLAAGALDAGFFVLVEELLTIMATLLDLSPERAFPVENPGTKRRRMEPGVLASLPNAEVSKRIRAFYANEQGNLDSSTPPFTQLEVGELLLYKATASVCEVTAGTGSSTSPDSSQKISVLILVLLKVPPNYPADTDRLLSFLRTHLDHGVLVSFRSFSSMLSLATHLLSASRISAVELSGLVTPLVSQAWRFLVASEPKFHVETVRCLWRLQTVLGPDDREMEAAIAGLMIDDEAAAGTHLGGSAEQGRTFAVLWSHTLLDNGSSPERRGAKLVSDATRTGGVRMSGTDYYSVMLTRPLFLLLDGLLDERTRLYMMAKAWLNSLVGVEQMFHIFANNLIRLPFLTRLRDSTPESYHPVVLTDDDDSDLCLYYLRTLSNVFRWAPEVYWEILSRKSVKMSQALHALFGTESSNNTDDYVSFQEVLLKVCMVCVACHGPFEDEHLQARISQLHRCALTVLHQLLLNPFSKSLVDENLVDILINRLSLSLHGPDSYLQVLLLDAVYASLRLREVDPPPEPVAPLSEKKPGVVDSARTVKLSITQELHSIPASPPSPLLKCLQAGLSSPSSRPVLDSWVGFMTECLPLYSNSIFQFLIPLVETLCKEIGHTIGDLRNTFSSANDLEVAECGAPESTLISLLNGLERVLSRSHEQLLKEESRTQAVKSPDQPQGFFGNMVSGVFTSDTPQSRSATANDRLTVYLAFQDAVRICFHIWSWGQGEDSTKHDATSAASFTHTSLRMRNRARRLLEHLFAAETLECLETIIDIWRSDPAGPNADVLSLLSALDGSRPKHTVPAIFNAIYSRTNPAALLPSRKSTLTIALPDTDLVVFLVGYAHSLEDDTMDEIWQDCMTFLRDLLANPFPHRQTLPSLLQFAAILGEKVDNTNFGEQRRMRRELADLFLRLLTALFTTRPMTFAEPGSTGSISEKPKGGDNSRRGTSSTTASATDRPDDVVSILASIVPSLPKILLEPDRILAAASAISANVIGPTLRSKTFPDTVTRSTLRLLQELSRLSGNQRNWKRDVGDAFNDTRFFGSRTTLVEEAWLPLLRHWAVSDKERMSELVGRISPPSTAGIVFGVGATSARLEADRRTQLNLRRIATLVLACSDDAFAADVGLILEKLIELLAATATSSPSSTTRAEVFMVMRALVLRISPIHLAALWPVVSAETHVAISSVVAADHSAAADTYNTASVLQACKLLDLLVCVAPDDFQLHEWLFVTDTIDAVYRSAEHQSVALVDELSEDLGSAALAGGALAVVDNASFNSAAHVRRNSVGAAGSGGGGLSKAEDGNPGNPDKRRPLLGASGISDDISLERKDELTAKVLRPFFGQLSIFAFESTYAMGKLDREYCVQSLLKDLFDERSIVKAL